MYIPKAFRQYPLGYTVLRDRTTPGYIMLDIAVLPIGEDPWPLKHGTKLVEFQWQATYDKPEDGWLPLSMQVYANTHSSPTTIMDLGSSIGRYLVTRFGLNNTFDKADFEAHWSSDGGGDGDLYYLLPRVLTQIAFPMLDLPRMIFDPRINEYVKATEIAPPWEDGWMDNNRLYGPEPGKHYQTIATQVTAETENGARLRLFRYMASKPEFDTRLANWIDAGQPVIAMTQRRSDPSFYVPDPLNDEAVVLVNPAKTYPNGRSIFLFEDYRANVMTVNRLKIV